MTRFVGLHPPQDVGADQLAQRAVRIVRALAESLGISPELLAVPQRPGLMKIEDRPQIAQVILPPASR